MPATRVTKNPILRRVQVARPALKDSRVMYTTKSLAQIQKQYGDNLMAVDEYHLKERVYPNGT